MADYSAQIELMVKGLDKLKELDKVAKSLADNVDKLDKKEISLEDKAWNAKTPKGRANASTQAGEARQLLELERKRGVIWPRY